MSPPRVIEIRVAASDAGKRLDNFIVEGVEGLSRSQAKGLILKGHVHVDGAAAAKAGVELETGALVRVEIPAPRPLDLEPREVAFRILFEDDELAVLDKPAGISVHPSDTETGDTLVHGLLLKLRSLSSVGGVARPGIVHRLDKGTSGVLVVSKTDAAHAGLSRQFKDHSIDRRYLALVYGDIAGTQKSRDGVIDTFYGRSPTNRKKMTGRLEDGRRAVTHWKVLETFDGLTLLECRLETGRTHQIRAHLSELGHSLVGDKTYGDNARAAKALAKKNPELARACAEAGHQLLHAFRLGFIHPTTQKSCLFETPPPEDFTAIVTLARTKRRG